MSYIDTVRRHRRLAILRHLADSPDYTSNASIMTDVLDGLGIPSSRDQVVTELAWLREQDLVHTTDYNGFVVAEATARGVEITTGRASHPEVQRPSPRR